MTLRLSTIMGLAAAVGLVVSGSSALAAPSNSLCVNMGGTGGCYGTLAGAIAAASNGDTIHIAGSASPYLEHLQIAKSLSLVGDSPATTIVDGSHSGQVIYINAAVTVTLSNLTLRNGSGGASNSFDSYGGALHNRFGTVTLNNVVVSGSHTGTTGPGFGRNGGGIYNESAHLTLNNSLVTGNATGNGGVSFVTGGDGGSGGGISLDDGNLSLYTSTLSGNQTGTGGEGGGASGASGSGGGVYLFGFLPDDNIQATISTTTFSGNATGLGQTLVAGGDGGGLFVSGYVTVTITNTTLAYNTMDVGSLGGGIGNTHGPVYLKNSLLAHNHNAAGSGNLNDCSGTIDSRGYNLLMEPLCVITATVGDQFFVGGLLVAPLANNGGPTLTNALPAGSPAVDAADNSACSPTDQRGFARPAFGGAALRCDIGAFELYRFSLRLPLVLR